LYLFPTQVLKSEFPKGVDVIYESVGGKMFSTCVNALAQSGRLVVIGMMSQYMADESKGWAPSHLTGLPEKLLWKSQQLIGFFLVHHAKDYRKHLMKLSNLHRSGHLKVGSGWREFVLCTSHTKRPMEETEFLTH
jgi:NADPH-dependent curcumin reductase CurA